MLVVDVVGVVVGVVDAVDVVVGVVVVVIVGVVLVVSVIVSVVVFVDVVDVVVVVGVLSFVVISLLGVTIFVGTSLTRRSRYQVEEGPAQGHLFTVLPFFGTSNFPSVPPFLITIPDGMNIFLRII